MDLNLPSDQLPVPEPIPLSTARVPVDPSPTTGYPAVLEAVRDGIQRAHGAALGNAWFGGFSQPGVVANNRLALTPGVVQLMLPDTDPDSLTGVGRGVRVEKTVETHLDIPTEGLLVLRDNGRRAGGEITSTGSNVFLDIAAGTYVINGVEIAGPSTSGLVFSSAANTAANQRRKVLVTVDATGTYAFVYGTVDADPAAAPKPTLPMDTAEVGWCEVPQSFTAATTSMAVVAKRQQSLADPASFSVIPLTQLTAIRLASAVPLAQLELPGGGVVSVRDARRPLPGRPRVVTGPFIVTAGPALVPVNMGGFVLLPGEALLITATATLGNGIVTDSFDHFNSATLIRMTLHGSFVTPSPDAPGVHVGAWVIELFGTLQQTAASYGMALWPWALRGIFSPNIGTAPIFVSCDGLRLDDTFPIQGGGDDDPIPLKINVFAPTISAVILPARLTDRNGVAPWWHRAPQPTASFTSAQLGVPAPTVT